MLAILAQQQNEAGAVIGGLFAAFFSLIIGAVGIIAMWRLFTKAGQPGWASLIPIYNTIVLLQIAERSAWWLLLLMIPFVNFVVLVILCLDLARVFGKGTGFGIGLIFLSPIFILILAFGDARYYGPYAGQPQLAYYPNSY